MKIAAEFDSSSLTRARKMFGDLDLAISKDAMNRLRSSPQGSVLGSLNALFSPHPVTGAPSPSQSAQGGLLGKMIGPPGGGSGGGQQYARNVLSGGGVVSTNQIQQVLTGATPGNVNTTNTIRSSSAGATPGNTTTTNTVQSKLSPASANQLVKDSGSTGDRAGRAFSDRFGLHLSGLLAKFGGGGGRGLPGGSASGFGQGLASGIGPGILGMSAKAAGGIGLGGALLGAVPALIGGLSPLVAAAPGLIGLSVLAKSLMSQTAPVTGLYQKAQNAQLMAVTPAQKAAAAAQMQQVQVGLAGLSKRNPALASIAKTQMGLSDSWQNFTQSLAPAFAKGISGIPALFNSLMPQLTQFFSQSLKLMQPLIGGLGDIARMVLPQFSAAIAAAAPLLRPLLDGLGSLVAGIFPGLITLVKAAAPAVKVLASVFGMLGKDFGAFFANLAPVLGPSGVLLKAIFGVVGGLLPIIAKLAGIFATALAPVFTQFAGVVQALLPFLVLVGKVLGSLAGAVLSDLVAAFGALAALLKNIAPALTAFATAISAAFIVLENTGVFAILGNAIESLAAPLGKMITALLHGLTPLLPPLIGFMDQLATVLAAGLAGALLAVIPPLTTLGVKVLGSIATILPVLLPLMTQLLGLFTGAVVAAVGGLATALAAIINALPPSVLTALILGFVGLRLAMLGIGAVTAIIGGVGAALGGLEAALMSSTAVTIVSAVRQAAAWVVSGAVIVASFIAQAAAATAAFVAENLATLGIIAGIGLLVAGIIYLATHWSQVWGEVKRLAMDAWDFLTHGWGQWIIPGLTLIRLAVGFVRDHWRQAWTDIKDDASNLWQWLWSDFGQKIYGFFVNTLPGWFERAVSAIGRAWTNIENTVKIPVNWVLQHVVDPLFGAIDDVTSFVGLGNPLPRSLALTAGGKLPGYGGGDILPALLEPGEAVIDKDKTKKYAELFRAMGVPGFASGGLPGGRGGVLGAQNPTGGSPIPGGGVLHNIGNALGGIGSFFTGLVSGELNLAKIGIDLAHGDAGGAERALLSLLHATGSGGAAGEMGKALLALPGALATDAMKYLVSPVKKWVAGQAGTPGGGVAQWRGVVQQALGLAGANVAQLTDPVLYQMTTESGGNSTIVNRTDSNWLAGHPSVGLMQVIQGTFDAYAGQFRNTGPYEYGVSVNPLANIYAAIKYAQAAYGPGLRNAYGGIGSGHGYARGGLISEPVVGYGLNTGQRYTLGEQGPEWVTPVAGGAAGPGGGSSQLAETINLTLPEGTAVAGALSELTWYLQTAKMRTGMP